MGCPLRDKCPIYRRYVGAGDIIAREACDSFYHECPYYQLCRNSGNVTRCIEEYEEQYWKLRHTGYEHEEAVEQLLEDLKTKKR